MRFKRQTPIKRLQGERWGKRLRKGERRESGSICNYRRKAVRMKRNLKLGDKDGEKET